MVALRSGGRQDAVLLMVVWGLTVAALVLGIILVAPILIFWGLVGLVGAGFLTRIHRRTGAAPKHPAGHDNGPADPAGPAGNEEKIP
ncbi:MAG: hypothetical protein ACQSGP_29965 [Frankia sp.]